MIEFECKMCHSDEFIIKPNGPHKALYCKSCGAWQKNLSKNEVRMYEEAMLESTTDFQMIGYANALKLFCKIRFNCHGCIFFTGKKDAPCSLGSNIPSEWDMTEARVNAVGGNENEK